MQASHIYAEAIKAVLTELWWLIPLLLAALVFKTRWFKGKVGEFFVSKVTRAKLPGDNYFAVENVTMPTDDGTTQIDHIYVSRFGVFVVETKNYKGWIFGGERQAQWTQQIYKTKNRFQNPLRQNYKHVKNLEATLGLPTEVIHSVIVFVGDCTFKTKMPPQVLRGAGSVASYIKRFTQPVLSEAQVRVAIDRLQRYRLKPSFKTDREHVKNLKARYRPVKKFSKPYTQLDYVDNQKNLPDDQAQLLEAYRQNLSKTSKTDQAPDLTPVDTALKLKCPKCGQELVKRTAKKGQYAGREFMGCRGFPECRYAKKL